jgi:hypothetical protein
MAQDALDAADADAVPLSQFSLWCTGTAVGQQLADDLLAESVDEPPASASRKRGSGAVVVELDMGDRLGSMRHYVSNIRVRVEAHKLHQCFRRSQIYSAIMVPGLVSRVQRTCSRIPTG